jgi:cytochrome c5
LPDQGRPHAGNHGRWQKHHAAGKGTLIHLATEGDEADAALAGLVELINNKFDEGE